MIDFGALNRIGRDIRKSFEPSLEIKLRKTEVHLLTLIDRHPEEPFIFYGKRIGLQRSSFTYLVETLEHKGLVIKKDSNSDKRTKVLCLTEEGKLITRDIERQFEVYLTEKLSVFDKDELEKLNHHVEQIKLMMRKMQS